MNFWPCIETAFIFVIERARSIKLMSEDAKITALHEPSKNHMCSEIHEKMFQCLFSSKGKAEYFNDSCHPTNINCIAIRSLINTLSIVQNGFQVHCRGSYFLHESSNKNLNGLLFRNWEHGTKSMQSPT